jgi:hypothetical protein
MPMIKGGNITKMLTPTKPHQDHPRRDRSGYFTDTAQIYGPFQNEELVGEAIKGATAYHRQQIRLQI